MFRESFILHKNFPPISPLWLTGKSTYVKKEKILLDLSFKPPWIATMYLERTFGSSSKVQEENNDFFRHQQIFLTLLWLMVFKKHHFLLIPKKTRKAANIVPCQPNVVWKKSLNG